MPQPALTTTIARLRRAVGQPAEARSDGGLLSAFLVAGDADAFAELVARFGPMVFGVCRRVTGQHQDAEDAFQATFVILARKAASIVPREAVGNWLHGVAVRTAREARVMSAKRHAREVPVAHLPDMSRRDPEPDDLEGVVHQELAELPEKFRTLLVLCDLRGEPQTEVARRLGLPVGTVYSRLSKARTLLAGRLWKRGVTLTAVGLVAALDRAGRAAIPAGLHLKTVAVAFSPHSIPAAVSALTNGVIRTMFLQKLALGVTCGLVLAAAGVVAANTLGGASTKEAPKPMVARLVPAFMPNGPASGDAKPNVDALTKRWEKEIRARLEKDAKPKLLAAKHPLVVLHSRTLYFGDGEYKKSAYSFIHESTDKAKHGNDVQILFHNGGTPQTFNFNMLGGQDNLVVDLGEVDFTKDPDPTKISIDHPGVMTGGVAKAVEGHVYLERVRNNRGNNFYVLFQVVAVDTDTRYMAFLWRKLPGGKVVKE